MFSSTYSGAYQTAFCVFQANTTKDKKGITIYVVELNNVNVLASTPINDKN